MTWFLASALRLVRRCPECAERLCPVYAALGPEPGLISPATYLMHAGFRR